MLSEQAEYKMKDVVRAYHFVPVNFGLDDLRHRRLKIARLNDLNDPFDLWAVAQPDPNLRKGIRASKAELARRFGMLCFSMTWHNPLLWSHYAARHQGLALGFDINRSRIKKVRYVEERPVLHALDEQFVHHLLYTKYIDWRYEQEARVYTSLEDIDPASGLYFADFSNDVVLKEVIVGPLGMVSESELVEALGEHRSGVTFIKARLAFNSFKVVKNKLGFKNG
jgi:hypothetical protein